MRSTSRRYVLICLFTLIIAQVTHFGKQLSFKTTHVSSVKVAKILPFRTSNVRLPEYRVNERRQSPFVGPHNYNHLESFNKINKAVCMASFKPDCAKGSDCFSMIGQQRIYHPAFEKHRERSQLIQETKDISISLRGPIPKGLKASNSSQRQSIAFEIDQAEDVLNSSTQGQFVNLQPQPTPGASS